MRRGSQEGGGTWDSDAAESAALDIGKRNRALDPNRLTVALRRP